MNDEIKIGTKIRALVDRPTSGNIKKDEIGIVTEIWTSYIVDFPSQSGYYIKIPLDKTLYEIMENGEDNTKPIYGRWYKVLVDNPKQIPYLKKGDYAKSNGKSSFLEFSNGYDNIGWSCSIFTNDLWELMPEGFEPETIMTNTFDLKIGDTLPKEIINKWSKQGLNYYGYAKKWESQSLFSTDRIILSFKLLDGVLGFEVSGTLNIYLKAEGFKEFMDNFDKKENNKFEVGKWYKTERGSIAKLKEIDNMGLFKSSEHFMYDDLKTLRYEGTFGHISKNNFILLTDLSEIQPYLPDGHPDKINTPPEYMECINNKDIPYGIIGRIYKFHIISGSHWGLKCNLQCGDYNPGSILYFNTNQVKPSTKESYDAQEKSKPEDIEKSEFKKGDYIVLIDTPIKSDSYVKNYIFKQRETDNYLVSVLDCEGSKTNGWSSIRYSSKYWRYATPEEITEYERLGKPYDVTTLNKSNIKKWSIGTYVVFVKEGYYGFKHCLTSYEISEIGSIGKISSYYESETITACKDISWFVFEKDLVKWFATKEEAETFAKTLINKNTLQQLPQKAKPKIAITDIPTTQPIVIKLNKKINYLIPKSI